MQETWVQSLSQEDPPGEGNGNPLQYFLPGEFHGQRSLVGSPWDRKELDMTEAPNNNRVITTDQRGQSRGWVPVTEGFTWTGCGRVCGRGRGGKCQLSLGKNPRLTESTGRVREEVQRGKRVTQSSGEALVRLEGRQRTRCRAWTRNEHKNSVSKEDSDTTLSYIIYDAVLVCHNYIVYQYYLCNINNKWYNFSDSDTIFNDRIWNYTSWAQSNMYSLVIILIKKNCMYIHAETEK